MTIQWVDESEWAAKRHIVIGDDAAIVVHGPGEWENDDGPQSGDWWAVSDSDGIFAYADNEAEAVKISDHFSSSAQWETIEDHLIRNTAR